MILLEQQTADMILLEQQIAEQDHAL